MFSTLPPIIDRLGCPNSLEVIQPIRGYAACVTAFLDGQRSPVWTAIETPVGEFLERNLLVNLLLILE
jgi:hypothetical protein